MARTNKSAAEPAVETAAPVTKPVTETAEFKAAIDSFKADIIAQLNAAGSTRAPAPGSDHAFADMLAMAIAGLTDQGSGRKHVAPQVIKARTDARERMMKLIVAARAEGRIPQYELRNKVYLDEVLVDPIWIDPASKQQRATVIEWRAVPNEVMVPINEVAQEIFTAFRESIGTVEDAPIQPAIQGVTAGGLTIKSGSKAVREVVAFKNAAEPKESDGGLSIAHRGKPGQYVEKNILGTVAPAARQTA